MREVLVEHLPVERRQRRAVLGELGGRLEDVGERQRAVIEDPRTSGQIAGDGDDGGPLVWFAPCIRSGLVPGGAPGEFGTFGR
jgi:hypothetical protein